MKIKPRGIIPIYKLAGKTLDEVSQYPNNIVYEMIKEQIRSDAKKKARNRRKMLKFRLGVGGGTG